MKIHLTYKHLTLVLLYIAALFGNYSIHVIGTLFLGDVIVLFGILAVFTQCKQFLPRTKFSRIVYCSILVFPIIGLFVDLINGIEFQWIAKGLARNIVFSSAVVLAFYLARFYKLGAVLGLVLCFAVSRPILGFLLERDDIPNLAIYVKYFSASSLVSMIIYFVRWDLLAAALMMIYGAAAALLFDSRSMGLMFAVVPLIYLCRAVIKKANFNWFLFIVIVGAPILIWGGLSFYKDESYFDRGTLLRREMSSAQRSDMAAHAWNGFLDRPLTGYGSWQHALGYIDVNDPNMMVGVHSWLLQFAYEYGIMGVIFGILLLLAALRGIFILLKYCEVIEMSGSQKIILLYYFVLIIYNICFSPFSSYTRIVLGLICGLLIILNDRFQTSISTTLKKRKFIDNKLIVRKFESPIS